MNKRKNELCCILFFVLGLFFSIRYYNSPVHDFGNYYFGSKLSEEGTSIEKVYEPFTFNLIAREQPGMKEETFLFNYATVPPFTLLFYRPFIFFDVHAAKFIFNLLSLIIFCFFLFRLLKTVSVNSNFVYFLPLIVFMPFRNNFLFGQTYTLLAGLLMAGFISETKNKNGLAAFCYSIPIALKISPAILLLYLLARKNYKLFFLTALFSTLFFFSATFFTGTEFMANYLFHHLPKMAMNEINNPYATNYQSFTVLLRNIFLPDQLLNPESYFNSPLAFTLLSGMVTGILFYFLLRNLIAADSAFAAFAFVLLGSFVLTAYTSSYSLLLLIPVVIEILNRNSKQLLPIILVLVICNLPLTWFQSLPVIFRFPRLYLLLLLFFLFAGINISRSHWKWMAASMAFFVAVAGMMMNRPSSQPPYYCDHEIALLTYDFDFHGRELILKTMGDRGTVEQHYPLRDSIRTVSYFYKASGDRHAGDLHLKSAIINDSLRIYLSDMNRGIGFYALRAEPLVRSVQE